MANSSVTPDTIQPYLRPDLNIEKLLYPIEGDEKVTYDLRYVMVNKSASTVTLNNLVIFIRFSDQGPFSDSLSYYQDLFNAPTSCSLKNFYMEVSYGQLNINSSFYPINTNSSVILSYQDTHPRGYYCKYSATNPLGYDISDTEERRNREHTLLRSAINYVKVQIPSSLNIDSNNDWKVDNICFVIQGSHDGSGLLWPHRWALYTQPTTYINGKQVYSYNLQLTDYLHYKGVGVLAHEFGHTIGAPDLYHSGDNDEPVGCWDLMAEEGATPQHPSSYVKKKYMHFIADIPEISTSGTYTLFSLSNTSTDNCYKIPIAGSPEYIVLEYRKRIGTYDYVLPYSGLIAMRINPDSTGNYKGLGPGGVNDEIYVFRPDGSTTSQGTLSQAVLSTEYGRDSFFNTSNPFCFISNGSLGNIFIKNISSCGDSITFDVRFCDDEDVVISNTNNVPSNVNASNNLSTNGSVTITQNDRVTLEAGNSVTLNPGFSVELGGKLNININPCGDK